jgi:hypothetical protein
MEPASSRVYTMMVLFTGKKLRVAVPTGSIVAESMDEQPIGFGGKRPSLPTLERSHDEQRFKPESACMRSCLLKMAGGPHLRADTECRDGTSLTKPNRPSQRRPDISRKYNIHAPGWGRRRYRCVLRRLAQHDRRLDISEGGDIGPDFSHAWIIESSLQGLW